MTRSAARTWTRRIVATLVVGACAALAAEVVWRHLRWGARLEDVRFLDHPEKVTGGAAAVTVTGYLVATIASDVDFFGLARAENAHPKVLATLCGSGKALDAWTDPLPRDERGAGKAFSYAVLVPARSAGVDLASVSDDVCLRFVATSTSPLSWVKSKAVVVPLAGPLREQMIAYEQREGAVQLVLDPACLPLLCHPDFTPRDLQP